MIMGIIATFIPFLVMVALIIGQGIWVTIDSRKREEKYWWLWTIISLIIFPLGIILYILITRLNKNICGSCGKDIPENAKVCPYCGIECIDSCPSCGNKIKSGWKYCPNCAKEITESISTLKHGMKIKGKQKTIIILMVLITVFILSIPIIEFIQFYKIGEPYEISEESINYFCNQSFKEKHTGTRSYTMSPATINYVGNIDSGKVVIKSFDSNGNLINESNKLSNKKVEGTFDTGYTSSTENNSNNITVTLVFEEFEGEFKMYR